MSLEDFGWQALHDQVHRDVAALRGAGVTDAHIASGVLRLANGEPLDGRTEEVAGALQRVGWLLLGRTVRLDTEGGALATIKVGLGLAAAGIGPLSEVFDFAASCENARDARLNAMAPADRADLLYSAGAEFLAEGDALSALAELCAALRLVPGDAQALYNRGQACWALELHDEAMDDWTRAVEVDPDYALAWMRRGAAFSQMGMSLEAVSDLERALEVGGSDWPMREATAEALAAERASLGEG